MTTTVRDNKARSRYELEVDGRIAFADYVVDGDALIVPHTLVPPELERRGVGSRLVAGLLDDLRAKGMRIVPACPFVAAYVELHPEVRDLVHDA